AAPLVVVIPLPDALQRSQCSSPVRKEMMFQAGTFQEVPTWWDLHFPVKITGKVLFGSRWYYAFTEQVPLNQISDASDSTAATLYQDHPNARLGFTPDVSTTGPYLVEINNREIPVGAYAQAKHKTETPLGTVFECEAPGNFEFVKVTDATAQNIYLGRKITDGVTTASSTTLTSITAGFTSADVGATVIG